MNMASRELLLERRVVRGRRAMRIVAGILLANEMIAWLYLDGDSAALRNEAIRTMVVIGLSLGLLRGMQIARWITGMFVVGSFWSLGAAMIWRAVTPPMEPNRIGMLVNITLGILILFLLVVPRSTQAFFDAAGRVRKAS
jgi:membrane associated rhomboid family serine protease